MLPHPGLARINKILLFAILITIVLYFGREFFKLISFAGLLAMLMTPVSNRLENHRFSGVLILLTAQIGNIGKELPVILLRYEEIKSDIQLWINASLGVSSEQLRV